MATAGADSTVQLFDLSQQRLLPALKGHSKRVNAARFAGAGAVVSGSADKSVRIWRAAGEGPEDGYECAAVLSETHSGDVVAVTVHPGRRYFVSASADASWAFWDSQTAECLKQVRPWRALGVWSRAPGGRVARSGCWPSHSLGQRRWGKSRGVQGWRGPTAAASAATTRETWHPFHTARVQRRRPAHPLNHSTPAVDSPPQVTGDAPYTSAEFHPDGLILATGGGDNVVRVWEMRAQKNVAQFEGHAAPVGGGGGACGRAARTAEPGCARCVYMLGV